jgi:hypothetical protein
MADPLALLGAMVLDTGVRWGEVATPVQRGNAVAVLTAGPDDPRLFWHELPKGHSKSTDAGCLSAVWLLEQAPALAEGYVVSSDEDQSNRLLDRARGVIRRTGLEAILRVEAKRISNVRTGARVVALAADVSSSEGLLSPWYVVDELPRWKTSQSARDMWTSVFSGAPKVQGARLLVLGHAGDPAHWSYRIREQARTSPRWRFLRVDGPTPWLEPGDLEEQRALLLPSQYAQRFLNLWTAGEDRLADRDDVASCVGDHNVLARRPGFRCVTGLDVGLTNDRCVATVAHRDGNRVVVDRQQVWAGTKAAPVNLTVVEEWLRQAHRDYGGPVVADPYQAVHLAQRLRAGAIRVEEFAFSSQSVGRLAVTLFRLIKDRQLLLPADDALVDELVNARLRETSPGVFRIDHDAAGHDDRVISLALAAQRLVSRPAGQGSFGGREMARTVLPDVLEGNNRRVAARDGFNPWAAPSAPWDGPPSNETSNSATPPHPWWPSNRFH